MSAFAELIEHQARQSLQMQPGCLRLEIFADGKNAAVVSLVDLHADHAAFRTHLAGRQFQSFDACTKVMVANTSVQRFGRVTHTCSLIRTAGQSAEWETRPCPGRPRFSRIFNDQESLQLRSPLPWRSGSAHLH